MLKKQYNSLHKGDIGMVKEIAVITGAGSGLGAALARKYSEAGAYVCLLGRTKSKLEKVSQQLGNGSSIYEVDVTSKQSVKSVIEEIAHEHGRIDILINNAGVGIFKSADELSENEVDQMIDTNLKGTIYCTQEVLAEMKRQNSGSIINVVSASGKVAKETESVYSASKFGVRGFLEALTLELKGWDIHVLAAYMGNMKTDLWKNAEAGSNYMDPDDVAEIILDNLKKRTNTVVTDVTILNQ